MIKFNQNKCKNEADNKHTPLDWNGEDEDDEYDDDDPDCYCE